MITISAESNAVINAIPPSIQNVIIMGNKDQIVFYTTQKSPIVLSYSTTSKRKVLSMNVDIATSHATIDSCLTSQIAQLRASCVEFACGSDVHVTVQSRHGQTETKDCRYWSSSSSIPWNRPPSHNLTSFHFVDTGLHYSSDVFQSSSHDLARMRCYSGDSEEPGSIIDPYRGTAVTFTCQS